MDKFAWELIVCVFQSVMAESTGTQEARYVLVAKSVHPVSTYYIHYKIILYIWSSQVSIGIN